MNDIDVVTLLCIAAAFASGVFVGRHFPAQATPTDPPNDDWRDAE